MNCIRWSLTLCLLAAFFQITVPATVQADENRAAAEGRDRDAHLSEARRVATEKRREWLRKHLTAGVRDKNQLARLNAQLDALDDQQVDVAAVRLLEQLDKRRSRDNLSRATAELARAQETRDALRRMAGGRYPTAGSPAGFYPVISVLPEGASLTASAVVSPDRRHVRVNVNPFFSSIGPVDTFNFYTGETYRQPKFNPQFRQPPPVIPRYDGLRTRNDRPPRR